MKRSKNLQFLTLLSALLVAIIGVAHAAESNTNGMVHLYAIRIDDASQLSFLLLVQNTSKAPLHVVADDLSRENLSISVQMKDELTGQVRRVGFGRSIVISSAPAPKPEVFTLRPDEIAGRVIRVENVDPQKYQTADKIKVSCTLRLKHTEDAAFTEQSISIPVLAPCGEPLPGPETGLD